MKGQTKCNIMVLKNFELWTFEKLDCFHILAHCAAWGAGVMCRSYQEMQLISLTLVGSMLPFLSLSIFLLPRVSILNSPLVMDGHVISGLDAHPSYLFPHCTCPAGRIWGFPMIPIGLGFISDNSVPNYCLFRVLWFGSCFFLPCVWT